MLEFVVTIAILLVLRMLIVKASNFRKTHGCNRILKKEYYKKLLKK